MAACGCVEWRGIAPGTSRPDDILKPVKPTLTPHYFRHNHVTLRRASVNACGDNGRSKSF